MANVEPSTRILEAWRGAYSAARQYGCDVNRAADVAQSCALALLEKPRALPNPRGFGRSFARLANRRIYGRQALREVRFSDGIGFGVEGRG